MVENELPKKGLLKKADTTKRFEYSLLGKAFEKKKLLFLKDRLKLLKTKEEKRNKPLKRIYRADEKFLDKKTDALLYIPKRELTKCLFLIFWQILQFTEQIYICGIFKENSQEIFPTIP